MKKSSRRRFNFASLEFQQLENRSLLAAVIDFDASQGIVSIAGTSVRDEVTIHYFNNYQNIRINTSDSTSSTTRSFSARDISEIHFDGQAGNDRFVNNTHRISIVSGGAGWDELFGGWGNDVIYGEFGEDHLNGRFGNDVLNGGKDNDLIRGAAGNDVIDGWSGFDQLAGGAGNDTILGGAGVDTVYGGNGNDVIDGGTGEDFIYAGNGSDTAVGGAGDDRIRGGFGNDDLDGGGGNDGVFGDSGDDVLRGSAGSDSIFGGQGNDELYGGSQNDQLHGDQGDDVIHGDAGDDNLYGGTGSDVLRGLDGDDGLFGGLGGVDRLEGGRDDDRLLSRVDANGRLEDLVIAWSNDDAIVRFRDLVQHTVLINGVGNVTFSAGAWTDREITDIDVALRNLQRETGNTNLLKSHQGVSTTLQRAGNPIGTHLDIGGLNDNGVITLTNNSVHNLPRALAVVYHEIGHNWDQSSENSTVNSFYAISNWRNSGAAGYTLSSGGNNWHYRDSADGFARPYGTWSPFEDYATTWETYFMSKYHGTNGWRGTDNVVSAKIANLDRFFATME